MPAGDLIGEIVRLQVQRIPIKAKGEGYDPAGIQEVERAAVDAWGMVGWRDDAWIVDVHHKAHPAGRGGGRRPLSIGFTAHYDAMAERFETVPLGVAGENIIVDGPALTLEDLGEGLVIIGADGTELLLERPRVAAPCLEFTSFMLGLDHVAPLEEIEDPLNDLHDGRRGFIVAADHASGPVEIVVGDRVHGHI
jgi:MOSC domain-containing protein YiiM